MANTRYHLRQLHSAQGGVCAYCGGRMAAVGEVVDNPMDAPSIDHVLPTARGGSDDARNKVAMHVRCNGAKGDAAPNGCVLIWRAVANKALDIDYAELIEATRDPPSRGRYAATLGAMFPPQILAALGR